VVNVEYDGSNDPINGWSCTIDNTPIPFNGGSGTGSAGVPSSIDSDDVFVGYFPGGANYYTGSIRSIKCWSRETSTAEKTELWNEGQELSYAQLAGVTAPSTTDSWKPVIGDMVVVTENDGSENSYWVTAVANDELTLDGDVDPVIGPNWAIKGYYEPYINVVEYDESYHYDPGVIVLATVVNGEFSCNTGDRESWGWYHDEVMTGNWGAHNIEFTSTMSPDSRHAALRTMGVYSGGDVMWNPLGATLGRRNIMVSIDRGDGRIHVRDGEAQVSIPSSGSTIAWPYYFNSLFRVITGV
jgi:hypothetical protein